jgi:hypothetical protein
MTAPDLERLVFRLKEAINTLVRPGKPNPFVEECINHRRKFEEANGR